MNGKFFDLKKEKQDRMINAAMKIFALQGYRHASTDDIVKEAGISKGLLFHYFGSKIGVYKFIFDYSVRFMNLELRTYVDSREKNLVEIIRQIECARMHVLKGYPYMQEFLNRSEVEDCEEALAIIEEKKTALQETYRTVYGQIDYALLPSRVDGRKIQKMLELSIKGLMGEKFRDPSYDPETFYEEVCEYLDMMKTLLA
ncbi:MAG: TetR/AcrR family transcriptional regulator [Acetatifactor sp.]|nr:TetR/AcrR family transcriptional regulator [Acetatifactor sp.]